MITSLLEKIKEAVPFDLELYANESLSKHTTFRIGGKCDVFAKVANTEQLISLLHFLKSEDIPYMILGNGSNTLFSDKGFRGVIISLCQAFKEISLLDENKIKCYAGAMLTSLCTFARDNSLSGCEELYGIPGSVGGATYMNAGAYGGEMSQIISSVTYFDCESEEIKNIERDKCDFSYRHSTFMDKECVILSINIELEKADKDYITAKMSDYMQRRRDKQPLEYPSAGSVFKRPEGYFAGALIEQSGLKGASVGGAEVSEKHAGFIINKGNATCNDVLSLIDIIKSQVYKKFNVELECEIRPICDK
ncbi:MAG: UDP-N-acetylmuramate dehydrogenase [Clostridia bacterium]|nr:UDP-N-acetylmuramate dehydrogenase [Clostridia bacterium]